MSEAKTIDTVVEDIYSLLKVGKTPSEENLDIIANNIKDLLRTRLTRPLEENVEPYLRMSSIGKPDRQVWYDINDPEGAEELPPHVILKFLYGDLIEELTLFLAREAGHTVTEEQREVSLDGVPGHIDAKIDGVLTDVKSTSNYAFKKFENGTLADDDPFGYLGQLSGYHAALEAKEEPAAFLALNKEQGKLALLKISGAELQMEFPEKQIERKKQSLLDKTTPPEKCYHPEPEGKSGNLKLPIGCDYCKHREKCWSDANDGKGLRTFLYSYKPVNLVKVVREPRVPELTR